MQPVLRRQAHAGVAKVPEIVAGKDGVPHPKTEQTLKLALPLHSTYPYISKWCHNKF